MTMTHEQMKQLAHLARLELTDGEIDSLVGDFDSILGYVEQLSQIDISGVHARQAQVNTTRPDGNAYESGLAVEKLLAVAPDTADGFYKMPKIL